ncbi:FecR family protein [Aureimonas leprariae]|uniref:FecR domain-containing protein n=1 Tax=Plantimonas leprariae TaxID=2615207 RepID=A0A7V7TXQ8_9HYPH|nr:FecR family protein [Aureimonas leprariae]KAB0681261.1 FecR domain-containing protein [Aureimonas leprariae]
MTESLRRPALAFLAVLGGLLWFGPGASAQQLAGCTRDVAENPRRFVFRCPGGLTVEAEPGSGAAVASAAPDGTPRAVSVRAKAVLVDLEPRQGRRFEIRAPQAIASVRGTVYAVDVSRGQSSVFVVEGRVRVAGRAGQGAVTLSPGEGVDVRAGAPLTVRRWPQPRASALLARFGR